mgnify:CR=1 FL=1
MINFFRKKRKKLADDNKVIKYVRYAIGEIVLVVIGILIALQLNTWKGNKIEQRKESIYLNNIKRDLQNQLTKIDAQIEYEKSIVEVAKPILKSYKTNHNFTIDSSFTASIGTMSGRMTFVRVDPTYTELLSSGHIDIISNNDCKNSLITYYQDLERIEQIINKNNNLYTDAVYMNNIIKLSEIQLGNAFISDDDLAVKRSSVDVLTINELRLKEITISQLENPENELIMINAINFRYFVSEIHISFMTVQKEKTKELISKLENYND